MLLSAIYAIFSHPTAPLSSSHTPEWLPVTSIYSQSFPTCKVDIACLQISFTNIFETKVRHSCWSGSRGKLAVEYVLRNSPVIHTADMAKPGKPSLTEQGKHARYSRLCEDILVWDSVLPGDAQNPSEAAQVEGLHSWHE